MGPLTLERVPDVSLPSVDGKTARQTGPIRIGDLARLCGVSPDTLRHYERLRLVRAKGRTPSGYRLYAPEAANRVRLVQAALCLGFTLPELSRLLGMRDAGHAPCRAVRALAAEKLAEVERRLRETVRLRAALRAVTASWDNRLNWTPAGAQAGLLDALVSGELALDLPRRDPIRLRERRRTRG